jgi:hypothetical protein
MRQYRWFAAIEGSEYIVPCDHRLEMGYCHLYGLAACLLAICEGGAEAVNQLEEVAG